MALLDDITSNIIVVFLITLYFYYLIVIDKDPTKIFFSIVILFVIYVFYTRQKTEEASKENDVDNFMKEMEKYLSAEHEMNAEIFTVHKTPPDLRYLKRNNDLKQILYEVKFLKIYDFESLSKTIAYLEYFLKIHYNIMIGEYDYDLFYPILRDIRRALLNIMKSTTFNIPNTSTIMDIPDIDKFLNKRIFRLQAITYKYVKILHNKFRRPTNMPLENDPMSSNHYSMY